MNQTDITNAVNKNKEDWVEGLARLGYAAIGVVYCLMGALAAMAAFGMGGQTANQKDVFRFLLRQPMGKVLLGLVAFGLVGYVIWRLVETFKDPRHSDSDDAKGYGRRAGFAFSALAYGALAFYAAKIVLGSSSGSDGQSSRQMLVAKALELPMGKWLVLLAAAGTVCFGLYQVYKGITGKFMKYVEKGNLNSDTRTFIRRTGLAGYVARGTVFAIIGYLLGRAAMSYNPQSAGGTESAMEFLQSSSIPYLMGVVALGLLCYGLFMFVRARYQRFAM